MKRSKIGKKQDLERDKFCYICEDISIRANSVIECSICELAICKKHARRNDENSWICVNCVREEIKASLLNGELGNNLTQLRSDIKVYQDEKTRRREEIAKHKSTILRLESQLKTNESKYVQKIKAIEEKIEKEENRTYLVESTIENLKEVIISSENSEKVIRDRLNSIEAEIKHIEQNRDNHIKDIEKLDTESCELGNKNQNMIPYKKLRTITCRNCHNEIKKKFKDQILVLLRHIARESLIESVMNTREAIESRDKNDPILAEEKKACPKCLLM
ncbi:unnamed protein product [Blepharisma stoltei]|uniref:Uncharacterized protein n=1 Tax=Blepharisma stoltei TaxID=1481888 RepID=A0AAU9J7P1_9CILI|nr:unnamed protein product [Blepharisma stoltei]